MVRLCSHESNHTSQLSALSSQFLFLTFQFSVFILNLSILGYILTSQNGLRQLHPSFHLEQP